ncbi:methylmalonyl-CoA mutase family protein [Gordonia neofelifaecis]|uniref:methylmalonyl-CoA mutase n=1 Tax=Gordonia neofelifaecis NRRL B-59395 TaxID=644548 RepID=F1YG35_9ACTN|nr:methylmalonyl-CoA mutase family protein [Gordonia neofelifaecis]EGD56158.1 methylmalonyl-CoA mutase, beta subunit [Gordonia neofelifaecis NRRL B-59395]
MTASDDPVQPRSAQALQQAYDDWSAAAAAVLAKSRKVSVEELPSTAEALLSTHTGDGTVVRPLYTRKDELAEVGLPGQFPFVRGADPVRDVNVGWRVTERFGDEGGSAADVNEQILDAAASGTSGLWLKVGGEIPVTDIAALLEGVYLDLMPVTLDAGADGIAAARVYLEARTAAPVAPEAAPSTVANVQSLGLSPYTAAFSGRPTVDIAEATAIAASAPVGVRAFRVDGTDFSQAGANNPQELGFAVAAAVAHIRDLVAAGATTASALGQVTFAVSVDDDQFAGVAKLRALRAVWARVAEVLGEPEAGAAVTHAVTDLAMLTQRDPWVNMLRSTVAAFGAGVGGADQVTVLGYDAALPESERSSSASFSHRIARNTQLLLLEESNLGRVLDPAGGSWFVESLTADLSAAAWDVFTEVERRGGYQSALADGWVGEQIAESLAARDVKVAHRTAPLTGVSEFPNIDETARPAGTAATVDVATATPKLARAARQFEALRDRADAAAAAGARPSVLMIPLGSVAEHNGRTTFVSNLLAAGGISAINPGPVDAEQIADLVAGNASTVTVLCGTAKRYATDGPAALAAARAAGAGRVLLAGPDREWPEGADPVDGSLRVGIDAVATLTELLDHLTGGSVSA